MKKSAESRAGGPLSEVPGLAEARGGAFYLFGEDEYRKERVVRALVEAHLDPATADFNLDPLRGTELDTERLASVLATPPMMAEWRVVVIREVEGLASSSRSREALLSVVEDPPPGLALILSCTVPQGSRAKFYKELAKKARSVEFKALSPEDVPGWLSAEASARFGLDLDIEAARSLGAALGSNLGILSMELEKLADFVGERGVITAADVEAAGTKLPSQNRWAWFDLVGERRFEEAMDALEVLFGQGETGVGLVIGLSAHLLRLGVALEEGPRALEAALPPHQRFLARRLPAQAKGWTSAEIEAALDGLLRTDRLLKASGMSDEHHVAEWLLGLMAAQEEAA